MGFLDDLLNRNPTRDWQPQRGLRLVLDLDQETFCGIGFGDPVSRLTKFGPAEDARVARAGSFRYPSRGFGIVTERGRVVEFELTFLPEQRYAGEVTVGGRTPEFSNATTEADLITALGPATERETHGAPPDETLTLRYQRTRGTWDFELDEEGHLETLWGGKRD